MEVRGKNEEEEGNDRGMSYVAANVQRDHVSARVEQS